MKQRKYVLVMFVPLQPLTVGSHLLYYWSKKAWIDSVNDSCQDLTRCGLNDKGRRMSVGPIMENDEAERQVCTVGRDSKMVCLRMQEHSELQAALF